jgi:hypothetical protein
MVRCSAMSWTDAEAWRLRVLVARRDLVTSETTMTEEQTVQRAHYTGTVAEKRFMERRWCERLQQARVDSMRFNSNSEAANAASFLRSAVSAPRALDSCTPFAVPRLDPQ